MGMQCSVLKNNPAWLSLSSSTNDASQPSQLVLSIKAGRQHPGLLTLLEERHVELGSNAFQGSHFSLEKGHSG